MKELCFVLQPKEELINSFQHLPTCSKQSTLTEKPIKNVIGFGPYALPIYSTGTQLSCDECGESLIFKIS